MQNQYIGYGIKGFYRVGGYAIQPTMNNEAIQQRLRALEFWDKHGLQAAIDHSGKSRRTLYLWRKCFREQGVNGLISKSTAPKNRRHRHWPIKLVNQIRYWRRELPNLGKEQIEVLLQPWCAKQGLD